MASAATAAIAIRRVTCGSAHGSGSKPAVDPLLNANGCTRGPWQRPAAGTFGNGTRSGFFGPHAFNADLGYQRISDSANDSRRNSAPSCSTRLTTPI